MNYSAETYSQFLQTVSDILSRDSYLRRSFQTTYENISNGLFLPTDFLDQKDNYPKYPKIFPVITDLTNFNLLKIYNCTSDDTNFLLDAITNNNLLGLKAQFDKIPQTDIKLDSYLQNSYFSNAINDLYNKDLYLTPFQETTYNNHVFETFLGSLSDDMRESSFILITLLTIIFNKNVSDCTDLYVRLLERVLQDDILNADLIKTNFNEFINKNETEFCKDFIKFIIRYSYGISLFTDNFVDEIYDETKDEILKIKDAFGSFVDSTASIVYDLLSLTCNILFSVLSIELTESSFNDNTLYDPIISDNIRKNFEEPAYDKLYDNYKPYTIKQYLLLNYYYKFWPKKFLNVLQLTIKKYVETVLKNDNTTAFVPYELLTLFKSIMYTVDWDNVVSKIQVNLTKPNLQVVLNDHLICSFASKLHFSKLIDTFLNPEKTRVFDTYLNNVYEKIFKHLRDSGQILHTFDYFKNRDISLVFLKTFLRMKLFVSGKQSHENQLSVSKTEVDVKYNIYSVDGVWLSSDTSHTGTNYFTGGSFVNNKITLGTQLPTTYTNVIVTYNIEALFNNFVEQLDLTIKDVIENNISININSTRIQNRTNQYLEGNISNIHQFVENIYTTSLTKRILTEHVGYYMI